MNLKSTEVHGQFPDGPTRSPTETPADGNESNPPKSKWRLVVVPKTFTVHTLAEAGSTPLALSCNYSILQAVAAILQIIYGSLELYDASKQQIPKYGYAAYSLTVIPYVVMSLTNLLATLCEPQYPSLFLVLYRGQKRQSEVSVDGATIQEQKPTNAIEVEDGHSSAVALMGLEEPEPNIIGAIGEAYGDLADRPEVSAQPAMENEPTANPPPPDRSSAPAQLIRTYSHAHISHTCRIPRHVLALRAVRHHPAVDRL